MFTTIALGMLSSMFAELVNAINNKLSGTFLKGEGAFLLAAGTAVVGGIVKAIYVDHMVLFTPGHVLPQYEMLAPAITEVWTVSQIYFLFVVEKFHLDFKGPSTQGGV